MQIFKNADIKTANRWALLKARIFGNKICDKRTDRVTIYSYKGVFYITDWLPEVLEK
jgi:hypothetical protein